MKTQPILPLRQSANVLIVNAQGAPLIVNRKNSDVLFCMPGGKLEPGESMAEGAAREFFEETGLTVVGELKSIYAGVCDTDDGTQPYWTETFIATEVSGSLGSIEPEITPQYGTLEDLVLHSPFWEYNAIALLSAATMINNDAQLMNDPSWKALATDIHLKLQLDVNEGETV